MADVPAQDNSTVQPAPPQDGTKAELPPQDNSMTHPPSSEDEKTARLADELARLSTPDNDTETPTRPAPLVRVPVEILWKICARLLDMHNLAEPSDECAKPKDGKGCQDALLNYPALANLSLTCKGLQEALLPLLYKRVKVAAEQGRPFIELTQRISQLPDHGRLIRELTIFTGPGSARGCTALSSSEIVWIRDEGSRLGARDMSPEHRYDLTSLLTSVLLCHTPDITKLLVFMCENRLGGPDDSVPVLPESLVFNSLRHLEIWPEKDRSADRIWKKTVLELLRCSPNLTLLHLGRCGDREATIQRPLLQLVDLHMLQVWPDDVPRLGELCPRLEILHLGDEHADVHTLITDSALVGPWAGMPGVDPFTVHGLLTALLPVRETLREFYLDWESLNVRGKRLPRLKDLALVPRFEQLQRLRLVFQWWPAGNGANFIFDFPHGIEWLTLGARDMPVLDIAQLLAQQVEHGKLPKLRHFIYKVLPDDRKAEAIQVERIQAALEGTGVSCTRLYYSDDDINLVLEKYP